MTALTEDQRVKNFIRANMGGTLLSTGAKIVYFSGVLYNITGSTHDPQEVRNYEGENWKSLLVLKAGLADARCYVTNATAPEGSNHDNFAVGGHMTTDPQGEVEIGGVSYLMPLCKWHNSTAKNGVAYTHDETKMLRLTGFMEGDTLVTFTMRMPSDEDHVLLYFDQLSERWKYSHLYDVQVLSWKDKFLNFPFDPARPKDYVIFKRHGGSLFMLETSVK